MGPRCPGRIANASVESTLVKCPGCGRTVELFGDEEKIICRCGQDVFRDARPSCFQWCKHAARCGGKIGGTEVTRYQEGLRRAFETIRDRSGELPGELGARLDERGRYVLPVLNRTFFVDPRRNQVTFQGGGNDPSAEREAPEEWQILVLHYLSVAPPEAGVSKKWIGFSDLSDARGYEKVYRGRVLGRLLRTVGRDREAFAAVCRTVGGKEVPWGDEGFEFTVFPRLSVILAWYRGDEELSPNVSFLYPDTLRAYLPVEDIVVLSELLVGWLQDPEW